jgi:hypothetical protein
MFGANPEGTDNLPPPHGDDLDIPTKTSKEQPSWNELNVEPAQEKANVDDSQALVESESPTAASPTHNTSAQPVRRGYGIPAEPGGHSALGSVSRLTRSNTKTALRSLGISIQKSLVESRFEAKSFLPRSCISELITRATIFEVLVSETEIPNTTIIVEFVSQEARILFAIMALMRVDLTLALTTAYKFGLNDNYLPISKEFFDNIDDGGDPNRLRKHNTPLHAFHYEPWDYLSRSEFFERQWMFLTPVFNTKSFENFSLHSRSIFPFIELDTHRRSSFFSDVYKVKIHPDHILWVRAPDDFCLGSS